MFVGIPGWWTSPRPIPWRWFIYFAPILLLTVFSTIVPMINGVWQIIPILGAHVQQVMFAVAVASGLSAAKIEGRWFHAELRARIRSWGMPQWLSSCYWPIDDVDEQIQVGRIKLIGRL